MSVSRSTMCRQAVQGWCGQQGPSLLHFVAPPPSTCDVMAPNGYLRWKYHLCVPDCAMEEGGEACGPPVSGHFRQHPFRQIIVTEHICVRTRVYPLLDKLTAELTKAHMG